MTRRVWFAPIASGLGVAAVYVVFRAIGTDFVLDTPRGVIPLSPGFAVLVGALFSALGVVGASFFRRLLPGAWWPVWVAVALLVFVQMDVLAARAATSNATLVGLWLMHLLVLVATAWVVRTSDDERRSDREGGEDG